MHKGQTQNAIALIVEGVQVNLAYGPNDAQIVDYIQQCMQNDTLCILKDATGIIKGVFRGKKISGVYYTQLDVTLQLLQIENLSLQNTQLKTAFNDDSWKHGEKFD